MQPDQSRLERSKREWMAKQAAHRIISPRPAAMPGVQPTLATHPECYPPLARNRTLPDFMQASQEEDPGAETHMPASEAVAARSEKYTPDWRVNAGRGLTRNENYGKEDGSLKPMQALYRELSTALTRSSRQAISGSRGGMRRLKGAEQNKWAYIDEEEVHDFAEQIPNPAVVFPFELDDFQKRAILHVEEQNSVFVAAHTSAGKTVVAEYAIGLAAQLGGKVFYTSPIKTLSNQKLRDFRTKFDDVGLVTGDVSINEDAQCVIMTTEILRSMLYRGADVIRDVLYVVFDEVQFLNDEERGVVWEESIIMLPPHVSVIMLSATVPNALEFASWVGKTRESKVAVVSTMKRPVPLRHSWLHRQTENPDDLCETLLLEQDGCFLRENYAWALQVAKTKKEPRSKRSKKADTTETRGRAKAPDRQPQINDEVSGEAKEEPQRNTHVPASTTIRRQGNNNKRPSGKRTAALAMKLGRSGPNSKRSPWTSLVKFLHGKDRTPAVIFCFSKKKCEKAVDSLANSDLLPDAGDKAFVHKFFENAIVKLREEDRNLPQVTRVGANLKRGISAHHAGLLPLIKEVTEILFSKGLVKILFATETFAMGVNMPARTVVFAAVRKHDGRKSRFLEAGEYTQMSGRAGRRGLDSVGNVHLFFPPDEQFPTERDLAKIMTGEPVSLQSAFRLTYNMILNVLRVDELRVEEMMQKSFSEADETSQNESIKGILDKAHHAIEALRITENTAESETLCEVTQDYERNALHIYVRKFCEVVQLGEKIPYTNLDQLFRKAIEPGRVVVAEVQPGLLSLAVVYCVVPERGRNNGRTPESATMARSTSQLWVAYIVGVVPNSVISDFSSVLFLPMSERARRYHEMIEPCVTSCEGSVVSLRQIAASKIVYICDYCQNVSRRRLADQENASRLWHFKKRIESPRKTLLANASCLEQVVLQWRKRSKQLSSERSVPGEYNTFPQAKSGSGNQASRSRRVKPMNEILEVHPLYKTRMNRLVELMTNSKLGDGMKVDRDILIPLIERRVLEQNILNKMSALKDISNSLREPSLLPEYEKRVMALQRLDYVGEDGLSVQLKGRCACDVSTVDSIILTEVVMDNVLNGLSAAEVASLLSSLVCRKKNAKGIHDKDRERYSEEYGAAKKAFRKVVQRVGKVQEECGVKLDFEIADTGEDYEGSVCRWDLSQAVYAWANGEAFFNITDLTEQQEGDIVVCIKRLNELLKEAQNLAKGIGNLELLEVLEAAVTAIRRDVVFNGSLYYEEGAREARVVDDPD